MSSLLTHLTADDVREASKQLDSALDSHAKWLARLHDTIVCGREPHLEDIAEASHVCCDFGRWYHGQPHPVLSRAPDFIRIGAIHRKMHELAREILLNGDRQCRLADEAGGQYALLLDHAHQLHKRVFNLITELAEDLTLVSKVADRVFEHASEGVMVTDAQSRIINVNHAFTAVTGYPRHEVIGKTPSILNSRRQDAAFYRQLWQSLVDTGHWAGEIWNRRKNGEIYLEWLSISAIRNDEGNTSHYVSVFSDITKTKQDEERLYRLAHYDPLTSLPNRLLFQDRLQQAMAHATRNRRTVALMLLDLDRFKLINDTLGHDAGDKLLIDVSDRLTGCLRESDTVARLGGDEFTVVVPDLADAEGAAEVARKIIDALSVPFLIAGQEIFVTTSIGISLFPAHGDSVETLTKAADIAMYQAKEQGGNTFQFNRSKANAATAERFSLEHSLRRALDRHELEVFYQPQVDIESGRMTGMEALLRWRHPERGLVMPGEFIPVAEDTGLILPMGDWVLHTACAQNKAWQDAGLPPLKVSVNLSVRQLKQRTLAEKVAEVLDDTELDAQWLELELTESMVMQNAELAISLLRQLKSIGVGLAIDDFGTGYSSLSYLKRFPIDTLKIDRSFIADVHLNLDDAAISQAIIALAHSMQLKVIAEGVENSAHLDFLRSHQCCDAQGYFFSRPLPADAVTRLLQENQPLGSAAAAA
jgi:diguanylate cyclase (GGDEF)-like protein/PAS domain S-box-containing protein